MTMEGKELTTKIVEKTIEVREAQIKYFRSRQPIHLNECKKLEKELDNMIVEYKNRNQPKQQNLF